MLEEKGDRDLGNCAYLPTVTTTASNSLRLVVIELRQASFLGNAQVLPFVAAYQPTVEGAWIQILFG